jgi:hypothetical protein
MKTTFITLASIFILSASVFSAENYTTLQISDHMGRTMEVFVKIEQIQDNYDFDTRAIFKKSKTVCSGELIDITPFVKPELEVKEDLPIYTGE